MANTILQVGRVESWLVSALGAALVQSPETALIYDSVSGSLAYLGKAAVGSLQGVAVWQIRRLVFGADGDVTITFAGGNVEFNDAWSDRAGLVYS